jgi:hypothetical protein
MSKQILVHNINTINSFLNSLDEIEYGSFLGTISNDYNRFVFVYKMLEKVGFYKEKIATDFLLQHIANKY